MVRIGYNSCQNGRYPSGDPNRLEEINLGTSEEARIIYISSLLSNDLKSKLKNS